MKNFKTILTVIVALAAIVFALEIEPSEFIQTSPVGWLAVRCIALVGAVVLGLITNYGGNFFAGAKEVIEDIKYLKSEKSASKSFGEFINNASGFAWVAWWVICFQLMAFFYIAEWCASGI